MTLITEDLLSEGSERACKRAEVNEAVREVSFGARDGNTVRRSRPFKRASD